MPANLPELDWESTGAHEIVAAVLAAFPGVKAGAFWVEEMAFATVPTAQSLVARRVPSPRLPGALVVGDVNRDGTLELIVANSLSRSLSILEQAADVILLIREPPRGVEP